MVMQLSPLQQNLAVFLVYPLTAQPQNNHITNNSVVKTHLRSSRISVVTDARPRLIHLAAEGPKSLELKSIFRHSLRASTLMMNPQSTSSSFLPSPPVCQARL